jgi:hypothetical protein
MVGKSELNSEIAILSSGRCFCLYREGKGTRRVLSPIKKVEPQLHVQADCPAHGESLVPR